MKRLLFAASMFTALAITVGVFTARVKAESTKVERATIEFNEQVKLLKFKTADQLKKAMSDAGFKEVND